MPLQDKSRPDRKVKARKVIGMVNETGEQYCFDSIHDMADYFGIATQTAYNIVRRKQVFRGMIFRYDCEPVTFDADNIPDFYTIYQKGDAEHGSRTETENARGDHAANR